MCPPHRSTTSAAAWLCALALATVPGSAVDAAQDRAFSRPDPALGRSQRLDFKVGRAFFERLWVSAPASTQAADGLGPLYNARSCLGCHPRNARGHPLNDGRTSKALVMRLDVPGSAPGEAGPEPTYGAQIQPLGVVGHAGEARLDVAYTEQAVELADGAVVSLRRPDYTLTNLAYGPLHPRTRYSTRVGPQLIGLGLLDAIDDAAITARADPDDQDADGISGRVNRVWSKSLKRQTVGRFGYKAIQPTLDEQSQSAFAADLGISTALFPDPAGDCTAAQAACRDGPHGDSPQYDDLEAHQNVTDLVHHFVAHLAVPGQRGTDDPDVRAGKAVFERIGCQACHVAEWTTGDQRGTAANRGRRIMPYTDLLLHDLGEGLADDRPEGMATGREWRTAPLWGIGLTAAITGRASYLHDGRARSLLEAVLWHGGEAAAQRDAVRELSRPERDQLIAFIESL